MKINAVCPQRLMDMFLNRHFGFSGVSPFFPAPGPFHASLRNTDECRTGFPPIGLHAAMLYVIDNEQARTIRSFAPGGARAGFQYVNEVSGSIEPYRAMPLLAISNTLNANGLATSAPKFWGNSCYIWTLYLDRIGLEFRPRAGTAAATELWRSRYLMPPFSRLTVQCNPQ